MRRTRPRLLFAAAMALALPLVACGEDDPALSSGTTAPPAANGSTTTPVADPDAPDLSQADWTDLSAESDVQVQARDNTFVDPYVEVKAGTTITFTNRGRNQHNVIAVPDSRFDPIEADDFEPGTSQTITLDEAGDYPYYCSLHGTTTKGMVGAIRVVE